ncbi:hypothetical protein LZZ85_20895 [Terrimonas sp. NA20]|uniref:Uncharacterized protein n=1 Tax=Terrimonas ginsenosidimutans TaxID=2908004 RepID=A0ABS9KWS3_9BACT|nr:hypothetical protein [Terrimonas ginsenosidimutans]MCG2616770.1 hypothetical protein [Terrimonas ginsenosidimutans]
MKKKYVMLFFVVLSITHTVYGQLIAPRSVRLPSSISTSKKAYEFSSMTWWGNRILMVPAMKAGRTETLAQPLTHSMYYTTMDEVSKAIADEDYEIKVDSIEVEMASFDYFIRSKVNYDGIEATAIVRDLFYFALETDAEESDKCYVAMAHLEYSLNGRQKLVFDKTRPIRKSNTGRKGDQGFESLVALNDSTLMAVFEFSEQTGTLYHKLNSELKVIETGRLPVLKATKKSDIYPNESRLSEMTNNGGVLVGLNSIFKDVDDCYSELISFTEKKGKFELVGSLAFDNCPDNWEGLLRFQNGWLVLSDNNYTETVESKLFFFPDPKAPTPPATTDQAKKPEPKKNRVKQKRK